MSRALTAASVLLACTTAGPAARALTLDEALRTALAQNPALASRVIDVSVADAHTLQAAGLDDFVTAGGAAWTHSRGANVAAQQTPLLPFEGADVNASLSRSFATGASVALRLDAPYASVASSVTPGAPGDVGSLTAFQPSAQLSVTQPLLRGRGYDVARAPQRQAHALRDVAGWDLEDAASGLARDVTFAYWELAYQAGDHELRQEALEAARGQLRAVAAQIDVGKQQPSASAEVEVSIAQREDELVDSESGVTERSAELARLLGADGSPSSRALAATDRPPPPAPPDAALTGRALQRNPALASLHAQALAASVDVDVARNALLPQLDATLSGGPIGVGTEAGSAFRSLGSFGNYTVQAGLAFQEPIELRGQRGARNAATGLLTKAHLGEADARTRVASDASIALVQLDSTVRRIALLERAVKTAELDVESETARFQANRSTSFDVLRRQQALTDVRIRLLRARVDNAKAAAAIDTLTDDILVRHGLALRANGGGR
ncbi:MAG TPA: TolC family protein [Polyangiaceae bacterium]|jgi:outer membrane protein TolC